MRSLSKAGKLYLAEYRVLTAAQNDVDLFLDDVLEILTNELNLKLPAFSNDYYKWNVWKNKSGKGQLAIELLLKKIVTGFRKKNVDVGIEYNDIRISTDITSTSYVIICAWTPNAAKELKTNIEKISLLQGESIYQKTTLELNLDSSALSAKKIATVMIDKCSKLSNIIDKIVEKG